MIQNEQLKLKLSSNENFNDFYVLKFIKWWFLILDFRIFDTSISKKLNLSKHPDVRCN